MPRCKRQSRTCQSESAVHRPPPPFWPRQPSALSSLMAPPHTKGHSPQSSTGNIAGALARKVGRDSARNSRFSASSREACAMLAADQSACAGWRAGECFPRAFVRVAAPRRMASTAISTLLHAVITITGSVLSSICMRVSRSRPSWPRWYRGRSLGPSAPRRIRGIRWPRERQPGTQLHAFVAFAFNKSRSASRMSD